MKKYDALKKIFEASQGITPNELSKKLNTSVPNIYVYLKELHQDGLIIRTVDGKYVANETNEKLRQILDLQAMSPNRFHLLIAPSFKAILSKMCGNVKLDRKPFSKSEIGKIEHIAIPSRIILKLSKRPVVYCLKINEALVSSLIEYHDLKPVFSLTDFNAEIEKATVSEPKTLVREAISDKIVIEMCENGYAKNEDISVMLKSKDFVLDDRLENLLKSTETVGKEYKLFLGALEINQRRLIQNQWERKYIYNTNSIEGNTMTEKDVEDFLKSGKKPDKISKREIYETTNMRHSLNFLKPKQNEEVSEELIKELHFMVQKDIDENAGDYKNFYNYVKPNSPTTPPQHVKERMRMLIGWYKENRKVLHPVVLASAFHMQFELIHPFGDGNGRIGRLLMNQILIQNGFLPVTVLEKTKQVYYNALANRSIQQFVYYILTTYIEEYKR